MGVLDDEPPDCVDFDGLEPPPLLVFVAELVVDVVDDVCFVFVDVVDLLVVDVVDLVVVVFFDFVVCVLVEDEAVVADVVVAVGVVLEAAAAFIAVLVFDLLLPHAATATLSVTSARVAKTTLPVLRTARAPTPTILNNYMAQGLFGLPKRSLAALCRVSRL